MSGMATSSIDDWESMYSTPGLEWSPVEAAPVEAVEMADASNTFCEI